MTISHDEAAKLHRLILLLRATQDPYLSTKRTGPSSAHTLLCFAAPRIRAPRLALHNLRPAGRPFFLQDGSSTMTLPRNQPEVPPTRPETARGPRSSPRTRGRTRSDARPLPDVFLTPQTSTHFIPFLPRPLPLRFLPAGKARWKARLPSVPRARGAALQPRRAAGSRRRACGGGRGEAPSRLPRPTTSCPP
ncbi:WAS/WASL-interacting protein family member 1-like [Cervus elaphus]|uniref:WAS/WASL-interacting protein family member 1-like n=1 Tax=Cervus elaphus TaxID=9860 RepID=UPI001CC28DA8|nr:WAS/WASL-interacting protein family member 1-like [Cervus elaphus]